MGLFNRKKQHVLTYQEQAEELSKQISSCSSSMANYSRLANLYKQQNDKIIDEIKNNESNKLIVDNYKSMLKINLYKIYIFKLFKQYFELGKMKLENSRSEIISCRGLSPFDANNYASLNNVFSDVNSIAKVSQASDNLMELQSALQDFSCQSGINIDPNISSEVDRLADEMVLHAKNNNEEKKVPSEEISKRNHDDLPSGLDEILGE